MSFIKINIREVKSVNDMLPSAKASIPGIISDINSAHGSIDGDVFDEDGSISGDLDSCVNDLNSIMNRLDRLYMFSEDSADKYASVERSINNDVLGI